MEALFEILFQFLGEFLLQFLIEAAVDIGLDCLADTAKTERHPVLSGLGYLFWGALAGGISLLILPHSMIHSPSLRIANLIGTPLLVSASMLAIGRWRSAKGREPVKLDRFSYAFCFAFAMAVVRFAYTA
ncbi:hypothetical protein [Novosphingobium sp.]|uniref:hypothetical protein n=1 Tax=Novosphingobium sp. TaxID=1874826 RepID=UPI0031E12787